MLEIDLPGLNDYQVCAALSQRGPL